MTKQEIALTIIKQAQEITQDQFIWDFRGRCVVGHFALAKSFVHYGYNAKLYAGERFVVVSDGEMWNLSDGQLTITDHTAWLDNEPKEDMEVLDAISNWVHKDARKFLNDLVLMPEEVRKAKENLKTIAMLEKTFAPGEESNSQGTRHLRCLTRRMDYLIDLVKRDNRGNEKSFIKAEIAALRWAMKICKERPTKEEAPEEAIEVVDIND